MNRTIAGVATSLALIAVLWSSADVRRVAAETECPDGDQWLSCQAQKGDTAAMYTLGRRAYEKGRLSGDFTEALNWSRTLVSNQQKNGERLLKMVYLEFGWGNHKDLVQAYVWLSEAIDDGQDYLIPWRKMLAEKMSSEQLAEAKKRTGN